MSNGPTHAQSWSRKDRLHGAGDHYRRTELGWAPVVTGLGSTVSRANSNLDSTSSVVLTKGAEAFDKGIGPLPYSNSQAQLTRKYPNSVKGKKVLARGLSLSSLPTTDRSSLRKLISDKPNSLSPSHAPSPNFLPNLPVHPSFKFTAPVSFAREQHSDWSEPQSSVVERDHHSSSSEPRMAGERQALPSFTDAITIKSEGKLGESTNQNLGTEDHGQSISVGNGDTIVEELFSPCSKEGSIYEDMGCDGMVSEGGDGIPPFD